VASKNKDFQYGVCYYPEAWHPDRHESDINRIADCGFNFVRMGEGAWSYWEPTEGHFQFDLFDRVLDLCAKRGIKAILGTPTYACPAWVANNYPEVLRWNFDRTPMKHGSRRNLNYTSPKMLDLSDRICTALADHYNNHPQVIGWQLDNEFNCHMDVSYAPSDTLAFRQWCRDKYKTLDSLNEAWGTRFWSQTYSDWDQIDLPHPTPTYQNPTALLDESRFISDIVIRFAHRQAQILRARNKAWFITHNGLFGNVNGPDLAAELDFFCHDHYPLFLKHWTGFAEWVIQARSLSFPFGIMEQQAGPGGQMQYLHRTPRPGEMRLWAWQSIANGANLLSFFRWRTCPYGSEQHWHGLLDADDRDNRRIAEGKQLGQEMKHLPQDFLDAPPLKGVAVLRDFDNEINDNRINTYIGQGRNEYKRWIAELLTQHVPVDEVWSGSEIPGTKWGQGQNAHSLLVLPHQKIIDDALLAKLKSFLHDGGMVVLGAQSGLKDRNLHVIEKTPPGLLTELAGVEVEAWTVLPDGETRTATLEEGKTIEFNTFTERLKLKGASAIAQWQTDDPLLASSPAITCNEFGAGYVVYVGGYCTDAAIKLLCEMFTEALRRQTRIQAPPEIEVVHRIGKLAKYVCLLNHSRTAQEVRHLPTGADLITGDPISETTSLPPHGVRIIEWK
jgi:beta-galactosidase